MGIDREGDWRLVPLSEVVEPARPVTYGVVQPGPRLEWGGIPLIRGRDYSGGSVDESDLYRIRPEIADAYRRSTVNTGDLLLSIVGYVGVVAEVPAPLDGANITQTTARVAIRKNHCSKFILFQLRSEYCQAFIRRITKGSAQPGINLEDVERIPLLMPPLAEQLRIAEILDEVDRRTEFLQRSIAKLELLRGAQVSDLLSRVDLSPVPLRTALRARPRNGYSPKESAAWTGISMLGLGCLTETGFVPIQLKNSPASDPAVLRALLHDGDLLMSRANTPELVGMVGIYRDIGNPCIYPDLMMRLDMRAEYRADYLELVLSSEEVRARIKAMAQGTSGSMAKITASAVGEIPIKLPATSIQDQILRLVNATDQRIGLIKRKLEKFRQIRQGLMDDLLSGKVRVKVAESAGM